MWNAAVKIGGLQDNSAISANSDGAVVITGGFHRASPNSGGDRNRIFLPSFGGPSRSRRK